MTGGERPLDPFALDRAHVWHPYASAESPGVDYLVESARGVRLRLRGRDGRRHEVIDAMASWWAAIHGYAVPALDEAARSQLGRMSHVMFGGLTHEPAVGLARRLVELAPSGLTRVFFADSGSVSVEVAMKMALQFQLAQGRRRTRFFTIRGGYHGDTFSPMSVTDPVSGMHSLFRGVLPEHVFAPRPPSGLDRGPDDPQVVAWEQATRALYAAHAEDIAAVIVEPVLQGAGGMHIYSPYAVSVLTSLARTSGALVIHDEIATGFFRTGPLWGSDHVRLAGFGGGRSRPVGGGLDCEGDGGDADRRGGGESGAGVHPDGRGQSTARGAAGGDGAGHRGQADHEGPDILCVGKALTGGYLSLAATLCTEEVARGVSAGEAGALMHGPTFMGNPLACAIAYASLELLDSLDAPQQVARVGRALSSGLAPARDLPGVLDVRTLGAVGVIQLDSPVDVSAVTSAAIERGVWVRPFRDLVYTMPAYVMSDQDVAILCAGLVGALADGHHPAASNARGGNGQA